MSHLVKPLSFRVGKTEPWRHNTLVDTRNATITSNLTLTKGLTRLSSLLLRRKRLYAVCGSIAYYNLGKPTYNLVYLPRIKIKPRERSIGIFLRRSLYKPINWSVESSNAKRYVHLRKEKSARLRRRSRHRKLNKWLTRRMFRGADRPVWRSRGRIRFLRYSSRYRNLQNCQVSVNKNNVGNTISALLFGRTYRNKAAVKTVMRSVGRLRSRFTHWKTRWKFDKINSRRFNSQRFSAIVSRMLHRPIKVQAVNLFSYLESKKVINYKNHQNHFWNFRYRRYRFQYKNYYDIINAFLTIGVMDNTEEFLFSILKRTLPLILKIRKFFRFLGFIIKYMPEIRDKFFVFRISITGKLAGGTKRTKFHNIGYGVLPVQTLSIAASNNFMSYTHVYGEFGLKLIMAKDPKYTAVSTLI